MAGAALDPLLWASGEIFENVVNGLLNTTPQKGKLRRFPVSAEMKVASV